MRSVIYSHFFSLVSVSTDNTEHLQFLRTLLLKKDVNFVASLPSKRVIRKRNPVWGNAIKHRQHPIMKTAWIIHLSLVSLMDQLSAAQGSWGRAKDFPPNHFSFCTFIANSERCCSCQPGVKPECGAMRVAKMVRFLFYLHQNKHLCHKT